MYVCGQIAQVVEHQTADPWIAGSSLTSGEKCKKLLMIHGSAFYWPGCTQPSIPPGSVQ